MKTTLAALAALLVAATLSAARADQIVTKTGLTYTGRIVAENDNAVTIDTAGLGPMPVARSEIAKIVRSPIKTPDAPAKPADAPPAASPTAAPAPKSESPAPAAGEKPKSAPIDDRSKEEKARDDLAKEQARQKAAQAALDAAERESRRRASKIIRHTAPKPSSGATVPPVTAPTAAAPTSETPPKPDDTAKPATTEKPTTEKPTTEKPAAEKPVADKPDAEKPTEEPEKATVGGTQLAQAERGSWLIAYEPPKTFPAAPAGILIGRRYFARLDSAGVASAWLSLPFKTKEERRAIRLADVQRHVLVANGSPRVRLVEGVDRGTWLRIRLEDETVAQGSLVGYQDGKLTLIHVRDDGEQERFQADDRTIVEVDGLMRSTATRLSLLETTSGESLAMTLWPDGRDIVGTLRERTDKFVTIDTADGRVEKVAIDGPIAAVHRVPAKWRQVASSLRPDAVVHVKSSEEFADSRVERDVIGLVAAVTPYAICMDSEDGVLAIPFESVTAFDLVESDAEAASGKPMKKSERLCRLAALPGAPAQKAKEMDPAGGVSAVTDGNVIKHVFVTAPFDGEVFGIRLGARVTELPQDTDLRFDTVVVPKHEDDAEPRPAEMVSHSLVGLQVSLLLDSAGTVSAIEVSGR